MGAAMNKRKSAIPRTIGDRITTLLREQILNGDITPGARLLQDEVARQFEVSITPVREAFARLSSIGLVRSDAHRGAQVVSPTIEDIRECYSIRARLEPLAVEWAIPRMTEGDLTRLSSLLDQLERSPSTVRYVELNQQFHGELYALSDSERLCHLIDLVREQAAAYLLMLTRASDRNVHNIRERADAEHRDILEACADHDPLRAAELLRAHLESGLRDIRAALEL